MAESDPGGYNQVNTIIHKFSIYLSAHHTHPLFTHLCIYISICCSTHLSFILSAAYTYPLLCLSIFHSSFKYASIFALIKASSIFSSLTIHSSHPSFHPLYFFICSTIPCTTCPGLSHLFIYSSIHWLMHTVFIHLFIYAFIHFAYPHLSYLHPIICPLSRP